MKLPERKSGMSKGQTVTRWPPTLPEEAVGIYSLAECHCYGRNIPTLLLPASVNHNVLLAPTTTPSGKLLLVGMA